MGTAWRVNGKIAKQFLQVRFTSFLQTFDPGLTTSTGRRAIMAA